MCSVVLGITVNCPTLQVDNQGGIMNEVDDYITIGDYVVFSGSFEAHVVKIDTDSLVKSFHGETAWMDAERWAWDNSKLY